MTTVPVILQIAPVDRWLEKARRQLDAIDKELSRLQASGLEATWRRVYLDRVELVGLIAIVEGDRATGAWG